MSTTAKYHTKEITETANIKQFKARLETHQQGKTDYPAFCNDSAASGVEKWVVCMEKMTCTYYDKKGNEILTEQIVL